MKLFFTHKEIALKKKRTALVVIGIGLVIGIYLIVSHRPAKMPELPVVAIAPATQDDVEIYGEYVGRVRAQQFVEVRARVEGYLEQMLFAEGTYVTKNQVLFVINQDQYRAKADKARAQLKKDEAQAQKAKRDLERIRPLYEQNAASQLEKKHYDFIIAMGDDTTDEDMFKALPVNAVTIKVGYVSEAASYNMPSQTEVLPFLQILANKKDMKQPIGENVKTSLKGVFDFFRDLLKTK